MQAHNPDDFWDFTPDALDQLDQAVADADQMYQDAVEDHARAANKEDRAYFLALVRCEGKSAAAADQYARSQSLDEREVRRLKEAQEKAAARHLQAVLGRLSAYQTKVRTVERVGG